MLKIIFIIIIGVTLLYGIAFNLHLFNSYIQLEKKIKELKKQVEELTGEERRENDG